MKADVAISLIDLVAFWSAAGLVAGVLVVAVIRRRSLACGGVRVG